mgnify:CR=1 FL=1
MRLVVPDRMASRTAEKAMNKVAGSAAVPHLQPLLDHKDKEVRVEAMKALNFTLSDARAYVALLKEHPATGYELAARSGVTLPLHACEHFYILTEEMAGLPGNLPVLRDPNGYLIEIQQFLDPAWPGP